MAGPVELQDNLSKAPLAAREQHIQQAASELGQRHAAQALEQEHILDQSRTRGAEEADTAANRVDDREGREGHRRSRGDRQANPEDDSGTAATDSANRPSPSDTSREIDLVA